MLLFMYWQSFPQCTLKRCSSRCACAFYTMHVFSNIFTWSMLRLSIRIYRRLILLPRHSKFSMHSLLNIFRDMLLLWFERILFGILLCAKILGVLQNRLLCFLRFLVQKLGFRIFMICEYYQHFDPSAFSHHLWP